MTANALTLQDIDTGTTARLAPHQGFNCFAFDAVVGGRTVQVIDAPDDFAAGTYRPSGYGIPILFPYPNRIRVGRFTWNGKPYHLTSDAVRYDPEGKNAIHGLCLDRAWRVKANGPSSATGVFQLSVDAPERLLLWPADFLIEVRYEVLRATLRADVRIANPSSEPLPWGFGTHPYFRLPLAAGSSVGRCTVEAPVTRQWELDGCLPTGRVIDVEEDKDLADAPYADLLKLDDVYTGLQSLGGIIESTIIDEAAGLQVTQRTPAEFRELVACTPANRDVICVEPYTCATDAINLQPRGIDAGLQILPPGGEFKTWFEITAGLVLA